METCADCGKPILMTEGSYYNNITMKSFHSRCGDPFGMKAKDAQIESLRATLASDRRYQAGYDNGYKKAQAEGEMEIEKLRAALQPFAEIADLVNHTRRRDGERVFELPKTSGGYFTLVREDFRRAARALEQSADRGSS